MVQKSCQNFFTSSGEGFVINFIRILKLTLFFTFSDRATYFRPDFNFPKECILERFFSHLGFFVARLIFNYVNFWHLARRWLFSSFAKPQRRVLDHDEQKNRTKFEMPKFEYASRTIKFLSHACTYPNLHKLTKIRIIIFIQFEISITRLIIRAFSNTF